MLTRIRLGSYHPSTLLPVVRNTCFGNLSAVAQNTGSEMGRMHVSTSAVHSLHC
jgi:hypothetical protein